MKFNFVVVFCALLVGFGLGAYLYSQYSPDAEKKQIPVKPFYVIEKNAIDVVTSKYTLVDKNGYQFTIDDSDNRYEIGDSIK